MERQLFQVEKPKGSIPWYQQLIMRVYVGPVVSARSKVEENNRAIEKLSRKILDLTAELPEKQQLTPVLVPPQVGLEESSRYWSATMTLEHLLSGARDMQDIIVTLARGEKPQRPVSLAGLKPKGDLQAGEVYSEFEEFMAQVPATIVDAIGDGDTTLTHAHPWFGELTARQWHWLMVAHLALHYKQLKNIRRGLNFEY